jgi:hypothetical protein
LSVLSAVRAQVPLPPLPPLPPIFVSEPSSPRYFDPYYNQRKVYRPQPIIYTPAPAYYETKEKKVKGNKVTEKITIRDQFGQVVYQDKKTKTKKKK